MTKQNLIEKIVEIETKVAIYQDRDQVALKRLEKQLDELNMQYLELMNNNRGL